MVHTIKLRVPAEFPGGGSEIDVHYITDLALAHGYLKRLHEDALKSDDKIVGLDTESRPGTVGCAPELALVQLCSASMVVIVRVHGEACIPVEIVDIIKDEQLKKAGSSIGDDIVQLDSHFSLGLMLALVQCHLIETQTLAIGNGVSPSAPGLGNVVDELFGYKLDKCASVRRCNWSRIDLPERNLRYAAMDAVASRAVAIKLTSEGGYSSPSLDSMEPKQAWADSDEMALASPRVLLPVEEISGVLHVCKLCGARLPTVESVIEHLYDFGHFKKGFECVANFKCK